MVNNFVPPKPGEKILLFCMECKTIFHGSNPGYGISRLLSKTRCPSCNSKKVFPHPGIHY